MAELMVERPGDQMMADQLEQFFPGITQRVSNSHLAEIQPVEEDDGLLNIVQAAITHRRQSRLSMRRESVMAKRTTLMANIGSPFARSASSAVRPGRIAESPRIQEEFGRLGTIDATPPDSPSVQSTPDALTAPETPRAPSISPG